MKIGKIMARTVLFVLICCVTFSGCAIMRCYNRTGFEEAYDYFSGRGKNKYMKFEAKITSKRYSSTECVLELDFDKVSYGFSSGVYVANGKNYEVLKENGFLDLDTEDKFVTIVSHPTVFWNGWEYPIVGVQFDNKVYLDEETGKANYLEYLQERIKYYS